MGNVYAKGIERLNEIDQSVMDTLDAVIDASSASISGDSNVSFDDSSLEDTIVPDRANMPLPGAVREVIPEAEEDSAPDGKPGFPAGIMARAVTRHKSDSDDDY